MKIAQISPLTESVPPALYGGTERVVAWLSDALVCAGHEVSLFASGDSKTLAELVPIVPRALRLDPLVHDQLPYNFITLGEVAKRAAEFDVLHFHFDYLHYPMFVNDPWHTLTTMHGRLDLPDLQAIHSAYPEMPRISISTAQRTPMPPVNWIATIHHGLPPDLFRLETAPRGYLAFLGRISPEKRVDNAIAIATRAGIPLRIAAKVDPVDRAYFHAEIEPLLAHPLVEYIGEIGEAEKQDFLGHALALLFPIDWPEPFGLVMIEAMACGTPVIAFRRGSVPEVITHGASGFIVDNIADAVQAVSKLGELPRGAVRRCFEERFTVSAMAEQYVAVYQRLILMQEAATRRAA